MFSRERLRIAKELRGLGNSEFAEKLGCSISKVKQLLDSDKEISANDQALICKVLNLPMSFFTDVSLKPQVTEQIFYRSVARIKAQHRKSNEAYTLLAMSINRYLMRKMTLPKFHRPDLGITEVTQVKDQYRYAENIAVDLRAAWGLGIQPINNIVSLCELRGIRVFRLPLEVKEIDALSFFDEESGSPFMFVNNFKSAERARFDCAHELGHVVMHTHDKAIRTEQDNRATEAEADRFASEFLVPTEAFFATIPRYITIDTLMEHKKTWRTSLKFMNYKAHKLGLLSDWVYRSNSMKITANGYHIDEPEGTHHDESIMLPKIISVLASSPGFNKNQMLDEIGISEDDFNQLTFDALAKFEATKKRPHLVLVD